jgi:dienelactone hydrolase
MINLRAVFIPGVIVVLQACSHLPWHPPEKSAAPVKVSYVAFQTLDSAKPLPEGAVLRMPINASRPMPAVVIVHGSAGIDSRGSVYAEELNRAGIATLEIDMWSARGIEGAGDRPQGVPLTLPDAYGAFKLLAANSAIDAKRIGIMGFSWGGVVSMLTATRPYSEKYLGKDIKFAAHAPNYPVCWVYNRVPGYEFKDLTGAPILLQAGELDTYDLPDTCPALVKSLGDLGSRLVTVKVYADAGHGWERTEPAMTIEDPYSHLGKGGKVLFAGNEAVAAKSRSATVAFFRCALGRDGCH